MPEGCAGAHSLGREGCQVGGTAWARARVWKSIDGGRPEAEVMQEEGTWGVEPPVPDHASALFRRH